MELIAFQIRTAFGSLRKVELDFSNTTPLSNVHQKRDRKMIESGEGKLLIPPELHVVVHFPRHPKGQQTSRDRKYEARSSSAENRLPEKGKEPMWLPIKIVGNDPWSSLARAEKQRQRMDLGQLCISTEYVCCRSPIWEAWHSHAASSSARLSVRVLDDGYRGVKKSICSVRVIKTPGRFDLALVPREATHLIFADKLSFHAFLLSMKFERNRALLRELPHLQDARLIVDDPANPGYVQFTKIRICVSDYRRRCALADECCSGQKGGALEIAWEHVQSHHPVISVTKTQAGQGFGYHILSRPQGCDLEPGITRPDGVWLCSKRCARLSAQRSVALRSHLELQPRPGPLPKKRGLPVPCRSEMLSLPNGKKLQLLHPKCPSYVTKFACILRLPSSVCVALGCNVHLKPDWASYMCPAHANQVGPVPQRREQL